MHGRLTFPVMLPSLQVEELEQLLSDTPDKLITLGAQQFDRLVVSAGRTYDLAVFLSANQVGL